MYIYILKYWKAQFTNQNQICKHDTISFSFVNIYLYIDVFLESYMQMHRCIQILYMFILIYCIHVYIYTTKGYFGEVLIAKEFDLHFRVAQCRDTLTSSKSELQWAALMAAEMFCLVCNKVSQTLDVQYIQQPLLPGNDQQDRPFEETSSNQEGFANIVALVAGVLHERFSSVGFGRTQFLYLAGRHKHQAVSETNTLLVFKNQGQRSVRDSLEDKAKTQGIQTINYISASFNQIFIWVYILFIVNQHHNLALRRRASLESGCLTTMRMFYFQEDLL